MAAYRVEVKASAERDLRRLSPLMLQRVEARLGMLAEEPRASDARKLAAMDSYRIRVGDHRIVYEIDDEARVVTVARIRHRREVYRRLR